MKVYYEDYKISCIEGSPKELNEYVKLAAQANEQQAQKENKPKVPSFGEALACMMDAVDAISAKEQNSKKEGHNHE